MAVNGGGPPPDDGPPAAEQQPIDLGDVGSVQDSPYAQPPTYNAQQFQDWVRSITNYTFLGIFALTVIASFYIVAWRGTEWTNTKDLLQLLLPAETALLGSAVGFYFGSQTSKPGK